MIKKNYELIKKSQDLIEEKRLEIKRIKAYKSKLNHTIDSINNIYEYLLAPLCAISITLATLFTGAITYILPIITAIAAITINTYKYNVKQKIEVLDSKLEECKLLRKQAYDKRENTFEEIFANLHNLNQDEKQYYEQILKIRKECDEINSIIDPYKVLKRKTELTRNRLSKLLTFALAPLSTIVLPLVCSFTNISTPMEVTMMLISTASLITCAGVDERLTHKIEDYQDTIDELKSDRTVKYIRRDIKLNEAIEYLKNHSMIDRNVKPIPINRDIKTIVKKKDNTNEIKK